MGEELEGDVCQMKGCESIATREMELKEGRFAQFCATHYWRSRAVRGAALLVVLALFGGLVYWSYSTVGLIP